MSISQTLFFMRNRLKPNQCGGGFGRSEPTESWSGKGVPPLRACCFGALPGWDGMGLLLIRQTTA